MTKEPKLKKLTLESVTEAYEECSKNPYIPAACFASKTNSSARYMTVVLNNLVKDGEFEFVTVGNTFHFRPIPKSLINKIPQ